jgi:hypothetical protein
MSEERQHDEPQDENEEYEEGEYEDQPAPTPFDNPFFLPVLLWAFAGWFAYDIITGAEAYQEFPIFNQGGCAVMSALAAYFTWSAIKEKRAERDGSSD